MVPILNEYYDTIVLLWDGTREVNIFKGYENVNWRNKEPDRRPILSEITYIDYRTINT
jgi:hypothetical protein